MSGDQPRPAGRRLLARVRGGWNGRARGYLVLSMLGLIGTWWFNAQTFGETGFFAGWPWPPGVLSLTVDLLIVATVACIFIILESQRLGMRHAWIFVLGSLVTAIAFTFPLFLAFRERHLQRRSPARQGPLPGSPTGAD